MDSSRARHEVAHGRLLAHRDAELIWGWGTPAGRLRARRRADLIARGANLRPGVRALEIGCGTGMFTEMFVETGAQLVAVDISADLLNQARARNLPPEKVQFLEKRLEQCGGDGPFDAVIGSSVLHHLDLDESLAYIHDLLKPGGVMSFAEPNLLNPQVFIERRFRAFPLLQRWLWYVSPDETAFVRWQLADLVSRSGFTPIQITPFDWLHPATPPPLIGVVSGLGRLLEATPVVREFAGSLYIRCERQVTP